MPTFHGGFPRHKPGQRHLPARQLNAPLALLERLASFRAGPGTVWTPFGPQAKGPSVLFRIGMTGGGGIPAIIPATGSQDAQLKGADVFECSLDLTDPYTATLKQWQSTYVGFNLSSGAVAGNAFIISMLMLGLWMTIWEDCPQSSGG